MTSTPKRECLECKKSLPLDSRHFAKEEGTHENWQRICRSCKESLRDRERLDGLEKEAMKAFLGGVRSVSGDKTSTIPHTAELLEVLLRNFGGLEGFSNLYLKQYFDAKPGSRLRNAALETVVRLTQKNTEQGGARKPVTLLSDEELEEEINRRISNCSTVVKVLNVTEPDIADIVPERIDSGAGRGAGDEESRVAAYLQAESETERDSQVQRE